MHNILNVARKISLLLEVRGQSILNDVREQFKTTSRNGLPSEITIDAGVFEANQPRLDELCNILNIDSSSPLAREIAQCDFITLYV